MLAFPLASWEAFTDFRDYRSAGSQPQEITIAQASSIRAESPSVRHWVRLTEPLQLECSQALLQTKDGKPDGAVILAFDQTKEHAVLLKFTGNIQNCEQAGSLPMDGMLGEPWTKFWTTHGMSVPSTPTPMLGLDVGSNPQEFLQGAEVTAGVAIISLALLCWAYFSKTRPPVRRAAVITQSAGAR